MSQSNTVPGSVQAQPSGGDIAVRYLERKLAAVEALASGRFADAHRLLLDLLAEADPPVVAGHCRYCGCSDAHGCAIAVPDGEERIVVRCSWWDDERTVCSRLSCIARFEREQGRDLRTRTVDPASRIVRP